jgi:hypothetical protein
MLFDLGTGRKKRVVQVIYAMLALLFLVGFVGFGIGGEIGQGGIADIFTGGSDEIEETQFSEDADELEQQVNEQPRNKELLVELISLRYSAGNALTQTDEETGLPVVTEEAEQEYEKAADAWDRYVALNPQPINTSAATFAVQSFTVLAQNAGSEDEADASWAAAADAQQLLAKRRPTIGNFSNLAFYSYASLDFKRGDKAAARAADLAANPGARKRIERQLATYRQQAKAYEAQRQQQEQQEENQGGNDGASEVPENPFGDVGAGGTLTPAPTP